MSTLYGGRSTVMSDWPTSRECGSWWRPRSPPASLPHKLPGAWTGRTSARHQAVRTASRRSGFGALCTGWVSARGDGQPRVWRSTNGGFATRRTNSAWATTEFKEWAKKGYVHARRVGSRKHLVIWADAEERERLCPLRDTITACRALIVSALAVD